jgi:transposase
MTTRKLSSLKINGSLNPRPKTVTDSLFQTIDFFDAHDLVQVKYEMLRRVHHDNWSVTKATHTFGLSRPIFYQAQASFTHSGLVGLLPQKRGPKKPHKLSQEVLDFIQSERSSNPLITMNILIKKIKTHFGFNIHQRSIEKALSKQKKKPI